MKRLTVDWHLINRSVFSEMDQPIHLFMIEENNEICYIGCAHESLLIKEITECIRLFNISEDRCIIWGGSLHARDNEPIGRDIVESVVCLMVNHIKPKHNIICKSAYFGYSNISITNRNFPFLPSVLTVYDTLNYRITGKAS